MTMHRLPIFIALVGIPGSGKSVTAERLKLEYGFEVISTDALREELLGDENDQTQQRLVFDEGYRRLERNLRYGIDTVFDATLCRRQYRTDILKHASVVPCMKIVMEQECDLYEALDRNFNRDRKVPSSVIRAMYKSLQKEPVSYEEGWNYIVGLEDFDHIESFLDIREYHEEELSSADLVMK